MLPRLRKVGGPAKVEVRVRLRNLTSRDRGRGARADGGRRALLAEAAETVPGATATRELTTRFTIDEPRLWQPGPPAPLRHDAWARWLEGERRAPPTGCASGCASSRRARRRCSCSTASGSTCAGRASTRTTRTRAARCRRARAACSCRACATSARTVTRSHYPLHPAFLEAVRPLRDPLLGRRAGLPAAQHATSTQASVRAAAKRAAALTVRNNLNHVSIMTWALANEPAGNRSELGVIGAGPRALHRATAPTAVRELDDTRLVAIDRQSRIGEPPTTPPTATSTCSASTSTSAGTTRTRPTSQRAPTTIDELGPYLDADPRRQPEPAAGDHRVRRRGHPQRARRAAGQLRVPAQVRRRPPARARLQALRRRLDLLGAARLPRAIPTWVGGAPARLGARRPGTTRA